MYNSNEISKIIKLTAKTKKVTIGKMLKDCNLNKNTLSSMQSGGFFPHLETIAKIADYLDCSVDYLIGRTDSLNAKNETKYQDEMTEELVKAFNLLDFSDRIEILNTIIEKTKK